MAAKWQRNSGDKLHTGPDSSEAMGIEARLRKWRQFSWLCDFQMYDRAVVYAGAITTI